MNESTETKPEVWCEHCLQHGVEVRTVTTTTYDGAVVTVTSCDNFHRVISIERVNE